MEILVILYYNLKNYCFVLHCRCCILFYCIVLIDLCKYGFTYLYIIEIYVFIYNYIYIYLFKHLLYVIFIFINVITLNHHD